MRSYDLAPIVLFVYNRPVHTRKTLNSLLTNELADQSHLYIYSDGSKPGASKEELKKIQHVRSLIREKLWCKNVNIIESDKNKGLADSIVDGVSEIVNKFGKIIVLEDDLVLSKGFLKYMNEALELYKNEEKVMHISGYMFPVKEQLSETFFLGTTHCWGWATWKRAWKLFNSDTKSLIQNFDKYKKTRKFNLDGSYDYYGQLQANANGSLKTWAVKWYANVFLNNGLCLHPNHSLIENIGHDNSGMHCGSSDIYSWKELAKTIHVQPIEFVESIKARKALKNFYNDQKRNKLQNLMRRVLLKFKN